MFEISIVKTTFIAGAFDIISLQDLWYVVKETKCRQGRDHVHDVIVDRLVYIVH